MNHPMPHSCPVCQSKLTIQELACQHCHTSIRGSFQASRLTSLTDEQLTFVEIFLKVRGNIKEMERELHISYPTVRNRLEQIISDLGFITEKPALPKENRQEILAQLDRGEITAMEAIQKLDQVKLSGSED